MILIVGGGTLQVPVVKDAKDIGLETIVIDRDPNCSAGGLSDHFEICDIYDPYLALDIAKEYEIDGVAAIAIDAEDTAAYVADRMDLPGPPLRAAKITRNKSTFYKSMVEKGLGKYLPGSITISSFHINYPSFPLPWIVRPINQAGSRGTTVVWNKSGLQDAVVKAGLYSRYVQICEKIPDGYEHSTEIMFFDKQPEYINTVLRPFLPSSFLGGTAVEIGHISPTPLAEFGPILFDLCKDVATALDVDWGVLKIDTLTPYGTMHPFLLEATLRLSGGGDSTHTYPLAFGKSSVRAYLNLAMGESIRREDVIGPREQFSAAAGFWIPGGTVTNIESKERIIDELGIEDLILRAGPGKWSPGSDCAGRAGFVITTSDSGQEAWKKTLEAALAIPAYVRM